ncbi:hypothetical protein AB0J82_39345 [Asanoa sp. NPDC049518]|uniref:hypothetical protein n=1 Tax=unclassified Asanoa TaxID=2685164 RepID=UPI003425C04A
MAAGLLLATVGGLFVAGAAYAQKVSSGSVSFSGDQGDYITQGDSYAYSTGGGDGLTVSSATGSTVSVSINAYNGDWWTLTFDAPGTQKLAPRTYSAAHRYPFNGTGPGLELSGEGRGCNELTGSFTVTKATFGADGYVQAFDATFEQHCEGGAAAARGKVHIANPAPPPAPATTHTTPASPRNTTTGPKPGNTSKPHATPTKKPRATPSGTPTAPPALVAAGAGGKAYTKAQIVRALLHDGAFVRRAVLGVSLFALFGFVVVGLVVLALVRHARSR